MKHGTTVTVTSGDRDFYGKLEAVSVNGFYRTADITIALTTNYDLQEAIAIARDGEGTRILGCRATDGNVSRWHISQNVTRELIDALSRHTGHPDSDEINAHLRVDLEKRAKIGMDTYGEELHTENGRDALLDLYEELLDAYQYSYQLVLEADPAESRNETDDSDPIVHVRRALECVIGLLEERKQGAGFLD